MNVVGQSGQSVTVFKMDLKSFEEIQKCMLDFAPNPFMLISTCGDFILNSLSPRANASREEFF